MKTVSDQMTKLKGTGNEGQTLTGKGSFSTKGFADFTNAMFNDTTHKVKVMGKDGKEALVSPSELVRADFIKSAANAKFPQKSEAGTYNTSELATNGIAEAALLVVREYMQTGRKVDIPPTKNMVGSIYLAPVAGKTKTVNVRDMKTGEPQGTTTITTKDSIQIRSKSPVPKHLQTKVRKDKNGNVVK